MAESWLHILKNAAHAREKGNYPISQKLEDPENINAYVDRIIISGSLKSLDSLLRIIYTSEESEHVAIQTLISRSSDIQGAYRKRLRHLERNPI